MLLINNILLNITIANCLSNRVPSVCRNLFSTMIYSKLDATEHYNFSKHAAEAYAKVNSDLRAFYYIDDKGNQFKRSFLNVHKDTC